MARAKTKRKTAKNPIVGMPTIDAELARRIARSGLALPSSARPGKFIGAYGAYPQTGPTTRRVDVTRTARKPGWRVSSAGNVYFENRRNRSDRVPKKRL